MNSAWSLVDAGNPLRYALDIASTAAIHGMAANVCMTARTNAAMMRFGSVVDMYSVASR